MKIEAVISEEMYCLFAPDGSWQAMTLAPDFPTCLAQIKMMHKSGMCKSYHELSLKGFKIIPIRVTFVQDGTEEEGFKRAKAKL